MKFNFIIIPLLLCSFCLHAEDNLRVNKIEITGLKRTKKEALLRIAGLKEGQMWNEEIKALTLRRLNNRTAFSEVNIEEKREGDLVNLFIKAKDKWSIIPLPLFASGEDSSVGGGIVESNFMGQQQVLVCTLVRQYGALSYRAIFIDPNFINRKWQFVLSGGRTKSRISDFYRDERSLYALAGYRFTEYMTLSLGYHFSDYIYSDFPDSFLMQNGKSHALGLTFEYDRRNLLEDYSKGFYLRTLIKSDLPYSDFSVTRVVLNWDAYINTYKNHTLAISSSTAISFEMTPGQGYIVGGIGDEFTIPVKGYEKSDYMYSNVVSGTFEYRVPVIEGNSFFISAVAFYDYAFASESRGSLFNRDFYSSAGLSLRFYLRNVAVPAFQLFYAYNFDLKRLKFGVLVGMGSR